GAGSSTCRYRRQVTPSRILQRQCLPFLVGDDHAHYGLRQHFQRAFIRLSVLVDDVARGVARFGPAARGDIPPDFRLPADWQQRDTGVARTQAEAVKAGRAGSGLADCLADAVDSGRPGGLWAVADGVASAS